MLWVIAGLEVLSVACLLHLWWRGRGSLVRRLSWSPLTLVPLVGPLLYGALYEAPSVQANVDRADATSDAMGGAGHH